MAVKKKHSQPSRVPDDLDKKIGARLRYYRNLRGLSQQKLGELNAVTFQQVQKYEKGSNRVAMSTMIPMLKSMNVTLAEFFESLVHEPVALTKDARTQREALELVKAYNDLPTQTARDYVRRSVRQLADIARP